MIITNSAPVIYYGGTPIQRRAKRLAKRVRYNWGSLYQGNFLYILPWLGWRISFVTPRGLRYIQGFVTSGSTVLHTQRALVDDSNGLYNKMFDVIDSPRAYLIRNWRVITWLSNNSCPIWTCCNWIVVIGQLRCVRVNQVHWNGFFL